MNGNITMADDAGAGDAMTVALAPKIPAAISILASYVLIRETGLALRLNKNGHGTCRPLLRIVLLMSVADIIYSIPYIFTTWAAPASIDDPLVWGNAGTTATCTAQGFFVQLGKQLAPLYNFSQALISMLMVRYSWSVAKLAHLELYLHVIFWVYGLGASIIPLFMNLYNSNILICYIGSYPIGCEDSLTYGESTCERGDNAWVYALAFVVFPLWPCIVAIFVFLVMIYLHVRKMEARISRYAGSSTQLFVVDSPSRSATTMGTSTFTMDSVDSTTASPTPEQPTQKKKQGGEQVTNSEIHAIISNEKSRAVATQAYWFMGSLLLAHSLNLVNCILFFGFNTYNELFDIFTYMMVPLQGLFNLLVFARPRPNMLSPEGRFVRGIFFGCCETGGCFQKKAHKASQLPPGGQTSTRHTTSNEPRGENLDSLPVVPL